MVEQELDLVETEDRSIILWEKGDKTMIAVTKMDNQYIKNCIKKLDKSEGQDQRFFMKDVFERELIYRERHPKPKTELMEVEKSVPKPPVSKYNITRQESPAELEIIKLIDDCTNEFKLNIAKIDFHKEQIEQIGARNAELISEKIEHSRYLEKLKAKILKEVVITDVVTDENSQLKLDIAEPVVVKEYDAYEHYKTLYKRKIDGLHIQNIIRIVMNRGKIYNLGDLLLKTPEELYDLKGYGKQCNTYLHKYLVKENLFIGYLLPHKDLINKRKQDDAELEEQLKVNI